MKETAVPSTNCRCYKVAVVLIPIVVYTDGGKLVDIERSSKDFEV